MTVYPFLFSLPPTFFLNFKTERMVNGLFDFDILKGARHVHKPAKPPQSQSSPTSNSRISSVPSSRSNKASSSTKNGNPSTSSSKGKAHTPIVKRPPPVSFEEMMALASKNLTKDDKALSQPKTLAKPTPSQPPKASSRSSLPSSLTAQRTSSLPANRSNITPSSTKHGNTQASSSTRTTQPPSKSKHSIVPALSSNGKAQPSLKPKPSIAPTSSSKSSNKLQPPIVKKTPPVSFNEMMARASKNLNKDDKAPSQPKTVTKPTPSQPPKASSRSSLPSSAGFGSSNSRTSSFSLNRSNNTPSFVKPKPTNIPTSSSKSSSNKQHSMMFKKPPLPPLKPAKRPRYEHFDHNDDEEGDDSMDDFIVDDEGEDVRKELKSVLRNYYRSDESVWQQREKEIDLRKMNARYQEIDAEEKRSYRIARMEDMIEEKRGSKALQ